MALAIGLERGLKVAFQKAYAELTKSPDFDQIKRVAMMAPSNNASEKYGWLGDIPDVSEWLGEIVAKELEEYDYSITNKNWQASIPVDKNSLDDDQYGMLMDRIKELPRALLEHRWEMIEDLFSDGTTKLAYDGSAFFANRSVNDNLLAGSGADTVAHIQADILSTYAAMYNYKSDTGRKLRIKMDTIVCPVEIYGKVLEAVTEVQGATSKNVPSMFIKEVIPLPAQDDTTDWYGVCTGRTIKPFILQTREEPKPELEEKKSSRQMLFFAHGRSNAGYGFPQLAAKVVNS